MRRRKRDCKCWNKRPDLRRDCDGNVTANVAFNYLETNDLIYEGIATTSRPSQYRGLWFVKQTTWFTKGLRHTSDSSFLTLWIRNKRPDLRRDCDFLFTKSMYSAVVGNKRPDLRRDCDSTACCVLRLLSMTKQTTWFTKGLRHNRLAGVISFPFSETNDLIYEGIATALIIWFSLVG